MRTVGEHIGLMRHALGKSPATYHDLYQTFQNAGNQLLQGEWSWAKRGPVPLAFRAGQDFFDLPDDFGRVVSLTGSAVALNVVQQVTAERLVALREGVVAIPDAEVYVCFDSARGQITPGVPSRTVGEVWPTPSANDTPVVQMVYRRSFPRFSSADDAKVPDIDESADLLLSLMAQDLAYLIENKRVLFDPAVIANETSRVKGLDGSRQWYHGQMSGGALDRLPARCETVPITSIAVT